MKFFDKLKARFPSILGKEQEKAWAVLIVYGRDFDLYRGDGEFLGTFERRRQAALEAQKQGLLLFDE